MYPTIIRTFTSKKCKIVTTNWIYNKTPYVQLLILPKPWNFYTIPDGVDGDILPVCFWPYFDRKCCLVFQMLAQS